MKINVLSSKVKLILIMVIKITYIHNRCVKCPDFTLDGKWHTLAHDKIIKIDCSDNNLTSLPSLSKCKQLKILNCSKNKLSILPSLSECKQLQMLFCPNNKLSILPSLSKCKKLNILKAKIDIFDQVINEKKILDKNVIKSFENLNKNYYDAIIFSVTHDRFKDLLKKNYKKFLKTKKNIVIDINGFLPKESSDFRL